jgi:hypothetical protein
MKFYRNKNATKRWGVGHVPVYRTETIDGHGQHVYVVRTLTRKRITLIWCGPLFILLGVK